MRIQFVKSSVSLLLAGVLVSAASQVHALSVQLSSAKSSLKATDDAEFSVTISNDESRNIRVLKWSVPGETDEASFFQVTRDGAPVLYIGKHYKRGAPTSADYITLRPGESLNRKVELSTQFDLSVTGAYQFTYEPHVLKLGRERGDTTLKAQAISEHTAAAATTHLWIEGSNQSRVEKEMQMQKTIADAISIQGVSYASNCSTSRRSTISTAFNASKTMAQNSQSYLNGSTVGARYTTWFGSYTSSRWNTAKSHFNNIVSAQNNQNVVFDCSCTQSYYAYVYPTQPYKIYLCNAFWSAPTTGTDSKGGTIVHELSHFNVIAATDDHAYGQTAAKNLAKTNPTKALDNADNHEYFAENTPYQN